MAVARHTSDSASPWPRAEAALGGGGEWTAEGDGMGPGAGASAVAAVAVVVESVVLALFASISALKTRVNCYWPLKAALWSPAWVNQATSVKK